MLHVEKLSFFLNAFYSPLITGQITYSSLINTVIVHLKTLYLQTVSAKVPKSLDFAMQKQQIVDSVQQQCYSEFRFVI